MDDFNWPKLWKVGSKGTCKRFPSLHIEIKNTLKIQKLHGEINKCNFEQRPIVRTNKNK